MKKYSLLLLLFILSLCFVFAGLVNIALADETVLKEYDETGNCILQMYLDDDGHPKLHNNSYFGLSRVYGEYGCISITYLDADRNPMINKSGYARVDRELDEDGHVIREMYYGINGEQTEIKHGQYGTQKVYENGKVKQRIPLGKNGKPVILLYQILHNNQWLVVVGAALIIVLCVIMPCRWRYGLLILYVLFVIYMTLYVRETKEDPKYSLELLWSLRKAIKSTKGISAWIQIIDNIVLFVPLGFILVFIQYNRKLWFIILECIAFSVMIEVIQYVTGLGFMEIDDVIWNGLGGTLAAIIATIVKRKNVVKRCEIIHFH